MRMRSKASHQHQSPERAAGTRITVTVPSLDYSIIRRVAKEKKVSASWVVRDAIEKYVTAATAESGLKAR